MTKHLLDGEHKIINDNYYKIIHAKQDRGNKEEIQVKRYVNPTTHRGGSLGPGSNSKIYLGHLTTSKCPDTS